MTTYLRSRDPNVFGRPGDGPLKVLAEVIQRRRDGAYHTITVAAPDIAERAKPGQFVNVAVEGPGTILRRPFSIHRVSSQGPIAGTIDFVLDAHGPGTAWLAERQTHDIVDVVGPLGSAFPIPQQNVPCLLVGGGYGVAPLFFLSEVLTRAGLRVDMIVGAANAERIYNAIEAKRMTASVTFTTEDGSLGVEGLVTDAMDDVIAATGTRVIYGCGPMPMLRAVSLRAKERGIPCQIAVEEHMACGVGVCWTCVIPIRSAKTGQLRMKRACIDGPVFSGTRVGWDVSRWHVPDGDAVEDVAEPGTPIEEGADE
ncbi:MAG: dihydroorotate dehydrogenase electron transfer subunit [Actinobacteria bacterium]|nr:dihydroorotate dehydrogenase electron transfer subunit [Actinomycetota bacterium]